MNVSTSTGQPIRASDWRRRLSDAWDRVPARAFLARSGPALIIVAAGLVHVPALGAPLVDAHSFRQAQTAFPALVYATEGIDLLRPTVPTVGPPWTLPFEFPIYQAVASLLIRIGIPVEVALRSITLACFVAAAAMVWVLVKRNIGDRAALIALLVFASSPMALVYGHASLIEYPAVLGALVFVYAILEWRRTGARRWLMIALIGGSASALLKLTTAAFWLLPAILTRRMAPLIVGAIAGGLGLLWTMHADAIKAANPNTAWLTSSGLSDWNFGGDRLDLSTWGTIGLRLLLTAGSLLTLIALYVVARPERLFWSWMAIALVGPLVALTNLYAIHDYYFVALTPALAAMIGGGADTLMGRLRGVRPWLVVAPLVALVATADYWTASYGGRDPEGILVDAAIIEGATAPDDFVVIIGHDWNPARHFYADRRGLAIGTDVPYEAPPDAVVFRLPLTP